MSTVCDGEDDVGENAIRMVHHDELSPLLNPTILTVLSEVCREEDLRSFRLVCKQWYKVSLTRWRRIAVLTVLPNVPSRRRCLMDSEAKIGIRAGELGSLSRSSEATGDDLRGKPYRRYRIRRWDFTSLRIMRDAVALFQFWGSHMNELTLTECDFVNAKLLEWILFQAVPNVEVLQLRCLDNCFITDSGEELPSWTTEATTLPYLRAICVDYSHTDVLMQIPWRVLLEWSPGLKTIAIQNGIVESFGEHKESLDVILSTIQDLRAENNNVLQINHLNILHHWSDSMFEFPSSTIKQLETLRLPLTKLDIDLGAETQEQNVKRLLECHSSTIQELTVYRNEHIVKALTDFPFEVEMSALRTLKLYGSITNNFGFLRMTPNLTKLCVYRVEWEHKLGRDRIFSRTKMTVPYNVVDFTKERCDMSNVKLERLEELQCDFRIDSADSFRTLTEWIPNVRSVRMTLTKETFPLLCERWGKSLMNLTLRDDSDVDDAVIFAISQETTAKSNDFLEASCEEMVTTVNHCNANSNISKLTELRHFTLETPRKNIGKWEACRHNPARLTDCAITNGFLHLPNLKTLRLYVTKELGNPTLELLKIALGCSNVNVDIVVTCACGQYKIQK